MATKQDAAESIQLGIDRVQSTFGSLTDEQLKTTIHQAAGGWTAKQILAHLASREPNYERLINMAETGASLPTGNIDFNAMNQEAVDQVVDRSRDELLAQFRDAHEGLITRVQGLPDDLLDKTIALPMGDVALGDVLMRGGGLHSINHAIEVEQALGTGN
jgi:uncharacterized damage-inducible protein DinB